MEISENYNMVKTPKGYVKAYQGEVEIIEKDKNGKIINTFKEQNIIKIFAKETISHRIIHNKVWDPVGGSSETGAWVENDIDMDEYSIKYIMFGASFDSDGNPLSEVDTRYYTEDSVLGQYVPISLTPGAEFDGGLINAIPIAEPSRPLKKIERIYYEPSYQPAGSPLLESDVRAVNNVLVVETVLKPEEYNGLSNTDSDYFTITEVALVAGREITSVGDCEADPRDLFLVGDVNNYPLLATCNGSTTITLDASVDPDIIKEGDQIKIVEAATTAVSDSVLSQFNPYYLVMNKNVGGRDIVLDRSVADSNGSPITGDIGVFKDGFRIFSHRILKSPQKKHSDNELTVRWRIIFN